MAEEFRQSATDSLGLPRRMWWLWPFVALLIVIWAISLWAVRVADTETALGVVTSHRGLGTSAQAEVALFVPSSIKTRVLGERVNVACQGISLEGQGVHGKWQYFINSGYSRLGWKSPSG